MRRSSPIISTCRRTACAVIQGDTDLIATGTGTGGSSSIPCGGASVAGATRKLADNLKTLAADALEAGLADLEIADGERTRRRHRPAHLVCRSRRACRRRRPIASPRRTPSRRRRRPIPTARISPRSRSIRTTGVGRDRQLRGGRRFRRDAQSADARRPGAWRRGAGHRPGADGAHRLRPAIRPARDREPDGLCAAACRRRAGFPRSRPAT